MDTRQFRLLGPYLAIELICRWLDHGLAAVDYRHRTAARQTATRTHRTSAGRAEASAFRLRSVICCSRTLVPALGGKESK
jgi:hypothetical protein